MTTDIYRDLQERLDKYSVGFPATESGIEITILKAMFSEQDAEMFLALSPLLETPEAIADRLNRPVAEVSEILADMTKRGLLFHLKKGDSVKYGAIPFVHGLFEFQVKRLDKDFAKLVEQYFDAEFSVAMAKSAEGFLRTIPIQESIDVTQRIAAYDDAVEILKKQKLIVITDCICRKMRETVETGCGKLMEACFMFGSMGQYYLDHEMGRQIDVDEGIRILTKAREDGLVTQPATAQNPGGMCNCCGDCCGVLKALNQYPKPAEMVFTNYFAAIDEEECVGCEVCIDRCQMGALTMNDDEKAVVNKDRCIGCGLCVTTCPSEAIELVLKPEESLKTPPVTSGEQMMNLAVKRGIQF
ncbi:MAG: 4Fe-4S binding protein [Desulfobacteraceae bacterium]|jgi:electron transport complex protein RnfB|nr:4Fe-4S binding protein [Desulfobacteraceae bacterium]